jgi:hypothetical protein
MSTENPDDNRLVEFDFESVFDAKQQKCLESYGSLNKNAELSPQNV